MCVNLIPRHTYYEYSVWVLILGMTLFMLFFTPRGYQYMIDEHHDKLVQKLHENHLYQIHEVGSCIS
jgi:hypothetical protein